MGIRFINSMNHRVKTMHHHHVNLWGGTLTLIAGVMGAYWGWFNGFEILGNMNPKFLEVQKMGEAIDDAFVLLKLGTGIMGAMAFGGIMYGLTTACSRILSKKKGKEFKEAMGAHFSWLPEKQIENKK